MNTLGKITLALALAASASAYARAQPQTPAPRADSMPTYQTTLVNRTARAVNYKHRSGATKIDFQGTDLMPSATGEAKVNSKRGALEVKAQFADLRKPAAFGNEYLTYVLWAISPEGRAVNLGEVLLGDDHRSKLVVTTDLQAFALIVTAEPYYAVRRPSNVVVLENVVRPDTAGTEEVVEAKYELVDRGGYIPTGFNFDPVVMNAGLPLEFFEARNAMRIAKSAGAQAYAAPSYERAVGQMQEADALATSKHERGKTLISISRETVQTAEDAREISMKRMESDRADSDRVAAALREADARGRADLEEQRRAIAESETSDALRQRNEADRRNLDAQTDAQRSRNAQITAEANSDRDRAAAASSDQQLQQAKGAQAIAEADSDRNRVAAASSDQQLQQAKGAQAVAEANSDRDRAAAASSDQQLKQAVSEREDLRASLLRQFNLILETRDTARGLVVNLSDVLFDTGQFTLRPLAREKLAKISGIVLAYPTLKLAVEGNTDSVGTAEFNQTLSEKRAESVRGYLTEEGVPESSTTAAGFGMTRPIAPNTTSEGRRKNRRVEMIVSGEVIGTEVGSLTIQPVATLSPAR